MKQQTQTTKADQLSELREELHRLYQNPLKNERKIDRIANEIRQIQEGTNGNR
jgi:hypothetical protein